MDLTLESTLPVRTPEKRRNPFERYLTLWVGLCMVVEVLFGQWAPNSGQGLRSLEFGEGCHVNLPIAVLIWLMITPMMKVDFALIRNVGRQPGYS